MKKLLTAAALASALLLSAPAAFAENWVEVAGYQGRMIDTDSCKVQGNTPVLTVRPTDGTEMTIQFNKKDMTYQFLSLKRLDGNGKVIDEVPADKLAGHFLPLKEGSLISSLYMQYVAYPIPQLANAEWVTIYRTGMGANAGSRVSIDKNHISYDGDYAVFWLKNDYVPAEKGIASQISQGKANMANNQAKILSLTLYDENGKILQHDARGEAAEVRDARQGIMNEAVTFAREHILQGTR